MINILTYMKLKRFKTVRLNLSNFNKDFIKFLYEKQNQFVIIKWDVLAITNLVLFEMCM